MLHRLRESLKEENNIVLSGIVEADETFIMPKISRDKRLQAAKIIHDKEQARIHGLSARQRLKLGIKQKSGRKKGTTKEVIEQMRIDRGGKPYSSKKLTTKTPFEQGAVVLGMMERGGKIVMKKIGTDLRSISKANIYPLLERHIDASSVLITDQLNHYDDTKDMFAEHQTVNHDIGYVVNGVHTNGIENAWKHLKKFIDSTYFHVSKHHFERYLDEHTYRWNRRYETEKDLFESFMPLVSKTRISYRRLIDRVRYKEAA
jgi:transposase-like protein